MILATFIAPQHLRPFSPIGLVVPTLLVGSSFFSLHGYKKDAAGMVAAQSALYILLAQRRRHVCFCDSSLISIFLEIGGEGSD